MAMKKWAMVIMNAGYDPEKDMARLDLEQVLSLIHISEPTRPY